MERVSARQLAVAYGATPEFAAKLAHANDLTALEHEATSARQQHVADACARLRACVLIGANLHPDDCDVVQRFIGNRTAQGRYGR